MTQPENDIPHVELNDKTIRLIGIPAFGIAIPNLTGLFGDLWIRDITYWLGYVYFIALAAFIWQGNRYLLFRTRKRFTWFDRPMEKLILLFTNNIFFTTPLTVAWLCMWYQWGGFPFVKWDTILVVALINVICVLFVTHVYETLFMLKEQQNEQTKNAELNRAKAEAELAALKNQVDPHFMFNSLNTLTYLISRDSKSALLFTENLAEVYRYILSQKDKTFVLLEDELLFTDTYINLLQLRFGNSLIIEKHFTHELEKNYLIPPTSVFVAFENVVKHNEISEKHPMYIHVRIEGNLLSISNTVRERKSLDHSSKIGLKNLNDRFLLTTGTGINTEVTSTTFSVIFPLLPLTN